MDDLAQDLRERLALLLDLPPAQIDHEAAFADLGVDSMMSLELVALVEQRLGFELPEEELVALQSIGDIIRYVTPLEAAQ